MVPPRFKSKAPEPGFYYGKTKSPSCGDTSLRSHLPACKPIGYCKGEKIYTQGNSTKSIYLVVTGTVEISHDSEGVSGALLEIMRRDELFGESAFLADAPCPSEQATALENTTLMRWAISDVEDLVARRPELAIALLHFFARRNAEINRRIQSLSLDTIERRLARSLIRFSHRLGTPERDGCVRMTLTHEMLSRHVGASSEIIAQCMNRFRTQGYVRYSRCGIVLYRDPFQELLSKRVRRLTMRKRAGL